MNLTVLGNRIREQREKGHLTQAQLANSLLVSPQAVSKWERGENAPDISLLAALGRVLGVSVDWLLSGQDVPLDTFAATLFCSSLRRFASHSAAMAPRDVALRINGIFHVLTESVLEQQGVPVKYVGDGFLAYFSGPGQQVRAARAALNGMRALRDDNLLVVLHSGPVYLGTIGHHEYASPDIMGDTVNTAFLVNQWATANSRAQLLLTEDVRRGCDLPGKLFTPVGPEQPGLPATIHEFSGGSEYETDHHSGISPDRQESGA